MPRNRPADDAGFFISRMARKSSYTNKLGEEICEQIAGGKSLVRICKSKKLTYSTVMRWLEEHEDFRNKYTQAREHQADYLADELLDIADNPKILADDKRIRVDARKWKAGKLRPKKYGEKIQAEHSGPDGRPLPAATNTVVIADLQTKSLDELTRMFTESLKA